MSTVETSTPNTLLFDKAYIDGQWVSAKSGKTFSVTNPATGESIADVADMDQQDAALAIAAADCAFQTWQKSLAKDRYAILMRWAELMRTHQDALTALLTEEQGKPIAESFGELDYTIERVQWYAEEAKRTFGQVIPQASTSLQSVTLMQPVGVVAAVTPWNFPIGMAAMKLAPAIAAGCTVVLKPAETTPLTALAMVSLLTEAGLPAGVVNVVTTNQASSVGSALMDSPIVKKLTFTGSTATGKLLGSHAAKTAKNVTLELGGNAPFIVFDDADLDLAIAHLRGMKFYNAGQICVCPNRIMVHESVHDAFVEKLKAAMSDIAVGNGQDATCNMGPLNNQKSFDKTARLVASAIKQGAKAELGGGPDARGGTYFMPTLLTGATADMEIANDEIFGPVVVVYTFKSEDDVIAFANDTPYGLAAYFFTQNLSRTWRVGRALSYGSVLANTTNSNTPAAPFGGMKESGIGRESGTFGISAYLEVKHFCMAVE